MSEYGRKRLSHNRRAADRAITIGATRPVICDGEPPYGPWRDRPVADAHGPHLGPEDYCEQFLHRLPLSTGFESLHRWIATLPKRGIDPLHDDVVDFDCGRGRGG
jgi:hypothetical protein